MTYWKFAKLPALTACMPLCCGLAMSCGSDLRSRAPAQFENETAKRQPPALFHQESNSFALSENAAVPVALNDASSGAGIQAATFRVSNCSTGYEKTVAAQSSGFSKLLLQQLDSGCLASLVDFTQNSIPFVPELENAPPPSKGEARVYLSKFLVSGAVIRKTVVTREQLPQIVTASPSSNSATEVALDSLGAFFQITESFEGGKQTVPGNILPSVSFEKLQTQSSEDSNIVTLRLLTDRILKADLVVRIQFSGTAKAGEDFEVLQNPVTLKSGKSDGELRLRIIDDKVFEGSERIALSIVEDPLYLLRNSVAEIEIADNDPIPNALALQYSERTLLGLGESIRTWIDETGNGHNANQGTRKNRPVVSQFSGGQAPNPGPFGYFVAQFLGESSGMLVSGSKLLDWELDDTGRSFAFVIQAPLNTQTTQVIYEQGTTKSGVNVLVQEGMLKYTVWAQAGSVSATTLAVPLVKSAIKHYLCVFDRSAKQLKLFENGVLKVTKETLLQPAFKSSKIGLGLANGASIDPRDLSSLGNGSYEGKLATFEIFQGALSEAAAKFHAEGTLQRLGLQY